jgi:hypothetical protein
MKRRILTIGLGAAALTAAATLPLAPASASPIPAATAAGVAGSAPMIDVQYRRYPRRGVRYYRRDRTGAAVAGAALGVIGGIAAAATAPRYYDYGYGYPAYGYPAYGGYYAAPVYAAPYGYGYGYYGY